MGTAMEEVSYAPPRVVILRGEIAITIVFADFLSTINKNAKDGERPPRNTTRLTRAAD